MKRKKRMEITVETRLLVIRRRTNHAPVGCIECSSPVQLIAPQVLEKCKRNPSEIPRRPMTGPDKELFEFDSFRLDPAEYLPLRNGEPVPLEPKVLETLLVLIRHGGRLVGKDELMQAV